MKSFKYAHEESLQHLQEQVGLMCLQLQVEIMARSTLKSPVEIQVGGRSVVNEDISQFVEIREPDDRFMRLLELLGEWQEQGKILVFVNSQEQCDKLFRDLLQVKGVS